MIHTLPPNTDQSDRSERYKAILPQLESLVANEADIIASLGNVMALLKQTMGFFWVGVYMVRGDDLVLSCFQGTVACTRIPFGKGVCGKAWMEQRTIVVPDVHAFEGHIACSAESKSEIVIPGFYPSSDYEVAFVLDVDSAELNDFSDLDEHYLEEIVRLIEKLLF